jgi:hypothetical protein
VDKGVPFIDDAPENGDELTLADWLQRKNSVSTAIGFRAAFQLRRQIRTWLLGHSYNFLFCGLKMNSALPGGRAGKNAIGKVNNTLNVQHVKGLSRANYSPFF